MKERDRDVGYLAELILRYLKHRLGYVKKVKHYTANTHLSVMRIVSAYVYTMENSRGVQLQIQRHTASEAYPRGYYFYGFTGNWGNKQHTNDHLEYEEKGQALKGDVAVYAKPNLL